MPGTCLCFSILRSDEVDIEGSGIIQSMIQGSFSLLVPCFQLFAIKGLENMLKIN